MDYGAAVYALQDPTTSQLGTSHVTKNTIGISCTSPMDSLLAEKSECPHNI